MVIRRGSPIRLGIVGLGPPWEGRFRESLARRPDRFRIVCVHDSIADRAGRVAEGLECGAETSIRALVRRPDVEAVALLGASWAGRFPLRFALESGKPCLASLPCRMALGELAGREAAEPHRVVLDLPGRFEASTMRLRELFATRLGRPRRLVARLGPGVGAEGIDPLIDLACDRADWCRFLFQAEPEGVRAGWSGEGGRLEAEIALRYPDGGVASLSLADRPGEGWAEVLVEAERGTAAVQGPGRLYWTDGEGSHDEDLGQEAPATDLLLEHFHRLATGAASLAPSGRDLAGLAALVDRLAPGPAGVGEG